MTASKCYLKATFTAFACGLLGCSGASESHADSDAWQTEIARASESLVVARDGSELIADDGAAGDYFGFALGLHGNTALMGAPGHGSGANPDQGSVYPFMRVGSTWLPSQPAFIGADSVAGDSFGFALAVSGETAVVGAPQHQCGDAPFQGAVYVFTLKAGNWVQQGPALTADDGAAADNFGSAVAVSGDTLLVGAPAHHVGSKSGQGAAYVFVRSGEDWTQQGPLLIAADGQAGDTFGATVALSGDTALVGAPVHQVGVNPYQGAAYAFVRESGRWTQQGDALIADDGGPFDQLAPCALSGDTALLGAPYHAVGNDSLRGSAYLFTRVGATWAQAGPAWLAADGRAGDLFGSSVALSPQVAVVAAPQHFVRSESFRGTGYLFTRNEAESWSPLGEQLSIAAGAADEVLGSSLALDQDSVMVGAPIHRVGAAALQGAVYPFRLEARSPDEPLLARGGCAFSRTRCAPQRCSFVALLASIVGVLAHRRARKNPLRPSNRQRR